MLRLGGREAGRYWPGGSLRSRVSGGCAYDAEISGIVFLAAETARLLVWQVSCDQGALLW